MPAAITDHFRRASSGTTRPVVTYLASDKTNGSTTAVLNAVTGWNTTTGVDLVIYRIDTAGAVVAGTQTDWIATLAGSTLSNMTLKAGTEPASGYPAGTQSVVIASPTAAWADSMVEGILLEHDEDGTHGIVTATSLTASGTVQGATLISTGDIQHRSISLETIRGELSPNMIASGCIVTQTTGANWSMTSGVVYINGRRLTVSSTTGTATLSKDTYFDLLDNGNGTVSLVNTSGNIVTNGASSPSLASNSLRIAVVVTSASTITEVKRGIFDSNGVSVYNAGRMFLRITGGPAVSSIQTLVDGSTTGIVSYGNVPMDWDGTSNLSLYTMLRTAGTGNTKTNRTAYRMRNAAAIATLEAAVDAPNTFSTTNIQVTRQIAYAASNFAKGDVIRFDYNRVGADGFDTLAASMDVDGIWIEYSKKYNV